jgi:hypothetical protein
MGGTSFQGEGAGREAVDDANEDEEDMRSTRGDGRGYDVDAGAVVFGEGGDWLTSLMVFTACL